MAGYTADQLGVGRVEGTFNTPINCPECGCIMSTDYGPAGLPAAHCHNDTCDFGGVGDVWLRERGHWEGG